MTENLTQADGQTLIGSEGSAPPSGAPSTQGMDASKIAEMISQLNQQGGQSAQPNIAEGDVEAPAPDLGQPPEVKQDVKKDGLNVPEKFRNPDGSVNMDNLLKSNSELEKQYGRLQNTAHENQQLRQQLDLQKQMMEDLKADLRNPQQQGLQGKPQYTPEEIKLLEEDPGKFVSDQIEKKLAERDKSAEQKTREQRYQDYEMLSAINQARAILPGFKEVENEIKELASQEWVGSDPKSIKTLYNAAIGARAPQLVQMAKDQAFKAGMEHHKAMMAKQVEGGGRDTSPLDTSNLGNIHGMSAADIEKLLPHAGDSSFKVEY